MITARNAVKRPRATSSINFNQIARIAAICAVALPTIVLVFDLILARDRRVFDYWGSYVVLGVMAFVVLLALLWLVMVIERRFPELLKRGSGEK